MNFKISNHRMKTGFFSIFFIVILTVFIHSSVNWRVSVDYGWWKLSPLESFLERQAENAVVKTLQNELARILPADVLILRLDPDVQFESHGRLASVSFSLPIHHSAWNVLLKVLPVELHMPFSLLANPEVFLGPIPLLKADIRSAGQLVLRTVAFCSMGGYHWHITRKFSLLTSIGLSAFPFRGTIDLPLQVHLDTILGPLDFQTSDTLTIAELRQSFPQIPRWIFAPTLDLNLEYLFLRHLGVNVTGSLFQGGSLAVGLTYSH